MSITEKYGFTVQPTAPDSDAVKFYTLDHLAHFGYPLDIQPSSTMWLGVSKGTDVWSVIGLKPLAENTVEVPDFYIHRSRWGILAAYAGLETIKEYSEKLNVEVITATPKWNTPQMRAMERVFGVDGPTHFIYRFRPWETKCQQPSQSP